jgi:hypothetical protein
LRSSTCISAPATASSPPTPKAASARGRRSVCSTCAALPPSGCQSSRSTSAGAIARLPLASASKPAAAASRASISQSRSARAIGRSLLYRSV